MTFDLMKLDLIKESPGLDNLYESNAMFMLRFSYFVDSTLLVSTRSYDSYDSRTNSATALLTKLYWIFCLFNEMQFFHSIILLVDSTMASSPRTIRTT